MKAHAWIGPIPLGRGSQARTLCEKILKDVAPIPLDMSDIPVGRSVTLPDWICPDCRKVSIPKCEERQFLYAVTDSREGK